jgi:hypothetical protein
MPSGSHEMTNAKSPVIFETILTALNRAKVRYVVAGRLI